MKKIKKEVDDQKTTPRPLSQTEVQRPAQGQGQSNTPVMQNLAKPITGPGPNQLATDLSQRQKQVYELTVSITREEMKIQAARPVLDMSSDEIESIKNQLASTQYRAMVKRLDSIMPMYLMLTGDSLGARELIRAVSYYSRQI